MSRQNFYRVTVSGTGTFPLDMLRHDQCFPLSEGDSYEIEATFTGDRRRQSRIELGCSTQRTIGNAVTRGRWASFGWRVLEVEAV